MSAPEKAAAGQLRSFVERAERLDEEIAGLNADKRDLFAEAKGVGFDVKALKSVLGIRRKDPSERAEHNAIVALYLSTLGMADAADEVEAADPRAHVQVQAPAHVREAEETRRDAGGRGEAQGATTVATVLPASAGLEDVGETHASGPVAEDTTPADFTPAAQSEGRAVRVGKALDEAPERGVGGSCAGQSEEFVTVAEAGEGIASPVDPASAPDDEVSRESASDLSVPSQALVSDQTETAAGTMEPLPAAAGRVTPTHHQEVADRGGPTEGDAEGRTAKSGVTAGESTGNLSPDRARRLAEYEADQKANRPPLDPKSSLFPILFKARYGRDPEPADYGETA